jgi:hypothetical protein
LILGAANGFDSSVVFARGRSGKDFIGEEYLGVCGKYNGKDQKNEPGLPVLH